MKKIYLIFLNVGRYIGFDASLYIVNLTDVEQPHAPYRFDRKNYSEVVRRFIRAQAQAVSTMKISDFTKFDQMIKAIEKGFEPIPYEATAFPQDYTYISMDKPKKKRKFPKQNFANNSIRQGKARQQIMRKQKCKRRC